MTRQNGILSDQSRPLRRSPKNHSKKWQARGIQPMSGLSKFRRNAVGCQPLELVRAAFLSRDRHIPDVWLYEHRLP